MPDHNDKISQPILGDNMTFEMLEDLFHSLEINLNPSALHGFLCGRLSWNAKDIETLVQKSAEFFAISDEKIDFADSTLRDFYNDTLVDLEDSEFLFQPLLPDDDMPINIRLGSLAHWCSNFVSGFADGVSGQINISEDGKQALSDLSFIGQVSDSADEKEENEREYSDVLEHVRLAVQVIFSDINMIDNDFLDNSFDE